MNILKMIGVLGGMSSQSTIEYYRQLDDRIDQSADERALPRGVRLEGLT